MSLVSLGGRGRSGVRRRPRRCPWPGPRPASGSAPPGRRAPRPADRWPRGPGPGRWCSARPGSRRGQPGPVPGHRLDPGRRALVAPGPPGPRDLPVAAAPSRISACAKAYSAWPAIDERRTGRTSSVRASSPSTARTQHRHGRPSAPRRRTRTPCLPPRRLAAAACARRPGYPAGPRSARAPPAAPGSARPGPAATRPPEPGQDVLVLQQPDELLGVQRVAAGPVHRAPAAPRRAAPPTPAGGRSAARSPPRSTSSRLTLARLRAEAAHPGARSNSSGRAVATSSSGTSPRAWPASCSRNSSSAASAQCRSSTTSTSGQASASNSINARQAAKFSSSAGLRGR